MTCAHCRGLEAMFDRREAQRALRRYRKRGPAKTTRALTEALRGADVNGATVLDIGGGVGAVPHALLEAGARAATDVDVSSSYVDAARAEAERRGVAPQIAFRQGDFVSLAAEIPEADVVTLDRVICCYPDVRALVSLSAAHARHLYGLVFPRDTWWARLGIGIINLVLFIMRNPMRTFVHGRNVVDDLVRTAGLSPLFQRRFFFWQVAVWSRDPRTAVGAGQNLPASIAP